VKNECRIEVLRIMPNVVEKLMSFLKNQNNVVIFADEITNRWIGYIS
jgi:hypothetical protein